MKKMDEFDEILAMQAMEKAEHIEGLVQKKRQIEHDLDAINKDRYLVGLRKTSLDNKYFQTSEITTIATEAVVKRLQSELLATVMEINRVVGNQPNRDKSFSAL